MIAQLVKFFRSRTVAVQIQIVLGLTTLIFWHFYTAFELVSHFRKELNSFDATVSTQVLQFVADNQASMQLFDYERVRENAGRLEFRYPTKLLEVTGQYGDKIFERGTELSREPLDRFPLPFGELQITRDFDTLMSFKIPLLPEGDAAAYVSGLVDLRPLISDLTSQLSYQYFFGMSLFLLQIILISFCARLATKPLELFARRLRTGSGEVALEDEAFQRSSEMKDLVIAYNQGIRTQRELQVRLLEAERKAGQAKLAAQVAHDLASPLSGFKVAMEYFKEIKSSDASFSQSYNLLSLSARRLEEITGELLKDFQARDKETDEIISIHRVLDELIGELAPQYAHVRFQKRYTEKNLYIEGNRGKIKRAFNNIIKNAAEAMEKEGGILCRTSLEAGNVCLVFADTGRGMSREVLEKIGTENFTYGKAGGHGLGLSVVREVLAESKGKMKVDSKPGAGTTVTLLFPEASAKSVKVSSDGTNTIRIPLRKDDPVIIVEDDPIFRDRWAEIVRKKRQRAIFFDSYEAVEASTVCGEDSHTAIVDFNFDSSSHSGFDVIRLLQERGLKHFTLCTGDYWKPDIQREAKNLGLPVCPKPLPDIEFERLESA